MSSRDALGRYVGGNYKKIDGVWYRKQCVDCGVWVKGINTTRCNKCYWDGKRNPVLISGKEVPHYHKAHYWAKTKLGQPSKCEECLIETTNPRQFNWANISNQYLLKASDWRRLCVSCHIKFDKRKMI